MAINTPRSDGSVDVTTVFFSALFLLGGMIALCSAAIMCSKICQSYRRRNPSNHSCC